MKNRYWFFAGGGDAAVLRVLAGALACALVLAGCGNPAGGDPPKTVAAEYRFTTAVSGGTFTLGETTAVKTGDNPFSLTGVYTEGGGTWTADTGSGTWVYLYDATGKRGIVMKYTSGSEIGLIRVKLGAATVETLRPDYTFTPALSTDGMSANPAATFYNE